MSFEPKPGLIIRYDYLWKEEADKGYTDGRKDRPCAIVVATKPRDDGSRDVIVCPITHSPPLGDETAVAIPLKMARHLNLDDVQCWVKTHQVNTIVWEEGRLPYGVVPAFKGQWVFGQLHKKLGMQVFEQVKANFSKRALKNVRRENS